MNNHNYSGFLLIEMLVGCALFITCCTIIAYFQWNISKGNKQAKMLSLVLNETQDYLEAILVKKDIHKKKENLQITHLEHYLIPPAYFSSESERILKYKSISVTASYKLLEGQKKCLMLTTGKAYGLNSKDIHEDS